MPIRSPRRIYLLDGYVQQNLDDNPDAIDVAPSQTEDGLKKDIIIKMKQAVGNFFGLEPIASNDPIMTGTFGGEGLNKGSKYYRNIGGFRVASYTLVAKSQFELTEEYYDPDTKLYLNVQSKFRTMSIGFPKGHSVNEIMFWLNSLTNNTEISHVITPAGKKHGYYFVEGL